jgi:hypothetical protein
LGNHAEEFFNYDNSIPTNQTKQELDQTRLTFVVTFVALGSLGCNKQVRSNASELILNYVKDIELC